MKDLELQTQNSQKSDYDSYELDFSKGYLHLYNEETGEISQGLTEHLYELSDNEKVDDELIKYEEDKKRKIKERKEIRKNNKNAYYVDPERMLFLIREYYKTDIMTEELALDIKKICDKLMTSSRFSNYTYNDEMAEDAFLKAYTAIYKKKFDINMGYSPFSYLTQIAFHAAQARIKVEKKERLKTDEYREKFYGDIKEQNTGINSEELEY